MQNEINGLLWCKQQSILAPKIFGQFKTQVVIDFVEGIPLDKFNELKPREIIEAYKKFGGILARIHSKGFSVGDCKAENVLLNKDSKELIILDLEQFKETKDVVRHSWDINEFIFYLGHYFPRSKNYQLLGVLIKAFLTNYFKTANNTINHIRVKKIKMYLGKYRLSWPYLLFMSPLTLRFIYKILNDWKNES